MASLAKEESALAALCKRCGGRCCMGHYVLLSASDRRSIASYYPYPTRRIDSPSGCAIEAIDAMSGGKCPFLSHSGCVLPVPKRPLVCRMYPLTYTLENREIRFHLSRKCPYLKQVTRLSSWIKATKKSCYEEVTRDWTKKEIRAFGDYLRKSPEELLDL